MGFFVGFFKEQPWLKSIALGSAGITLVVTVILLTQGSTAERLAFLGFAFLILAFALLWVVFIGTINTALNPPKPDPPPAGEVQGNVAAEVVDAIKALASAPAWLALIVVGIGLVVLGSLYDGYRFADGGITDRPPPTAVPAAPTPTPTS